MQSFYQADNSPSVPITDESANLRPKESGKESRCAKQTQSNEKPLPIERSHQRELRKLDARLKEFMELFGSHATTVNVGFCGQLLSREIIDNRLIICG
jgi:hypothetical protein